jgi:hypothetical protein
MDDEARRVKIRRFVEAINAGEMEPFDAITTTWSSTGPSRVR